MSPVELPDAPVAPAPTPETEASDFKPAPKKPMPKHFETAIEDKLPFLHKLAYGLGQVCNNLLAASLGCMMIVLNLGLKMDPAAIGTIMFIARLWDAVTDPVMGYISDHTKSRWGRRRPYILTGAIASGVVFALMWQLPPGQSQSFYFWFFTGGTLLFYLAYTVFATPFVALGYESTPDYHERTRLMGFGNFMGQIVWLAVPWFYKFMENDRLFDNSVEGAKTLAIIVGALVILFGIMPALIIRERYRAVAKAEEQAAPTQGVAKHTLDFFKGFFVALKFKPFLLLCAATFLVFNGFMAISGFSSYVIIYYIFGGNQDAGATYMGLFGTISSIATFGIIALVTWLSTKIGKRTAFFWSTGISVVGYGLKWFCYQPEHPWMLLLPAPLIACGLGGLFTTVGAMTADVCDLDELQNGKRREGLFGAIYWWMVKLGMSVAFLLGGYLLNATGFNVELGSAQSEHTLLMLRVYDVGVPVLTSLLAIWAVWGYKVTEQNAYEIRAQLEARRGKTVAAT
jgi:GPH family glycoside/pentoside/hexuronide:cation symporter